MVSTKQLGIACLVLLILGIVAMVSNADTYDSYTGVIAEAARSGGETGANGIAIATASPKLELMTGDSTWDLSGDDRELHALEGRPVTVVGAAHNGTIHVAAVYQPKR